MRFLLQNRLTIIVPVPEPNFFLPNPCFFRKIQAYFVSYSLTKTQVFDPRCGGVAQLGERCVRNAEVGSSILLLSTTYEARREKPGGLLLFPLSKILTVFERLRSSEHSRPRAAPRRLCCAAALRPPGIRSAGRALFFFRTLQVFRFPYRYGARTSRKNRMFRAYCALVMRKSYGRA